MPKAGAGCVTSAFAERLTGGRYIDVQIDRDAAARFGLNIADVQAVVSAAIGGDDIGETIKGLQRFPINVRYPREIRDSVQKLRELPVLTDRGAQILLSDVAAVRISDGPPVLKSENARLSDWVYVDLHGRDLSSAVRDMQRACVRPKFRLRQGGRAVDSLRILICQRPQDRTVRRASVARARLYERCEPVTHASQICNARLDVTEFRLGRAFDACDITLRREGEEFLDLLQCEAQRLGATDETQSGQLKLAITSIPRRQSPVRRQEPVALVVPHCVDADATAFGQLTDSQRFHFGLPSVSSPD
jgi:AcrB/AcrD/AcrF family